MPGRNLIAVLQKERRNQDKNGIYRKLQIDFSYHSNAIEGSDMSYEQTRSAYDTQTVSGKPVHVDDVLETVNHFQCFDDILRNYDKPLTEGFIKNLQATLKASTFDSDRPHAVLGDYKLVPNTVGGIETTCPELVHGQMKDLLDEWNEKPDHTLDDILIFHARYETIHPFYDGNGRTGRLIMFKECLRYGILPFLVLVQYKHEYYRGLREYQLDKDKTWLQETGFHMQEEMMKTLEQFKIQI